MKSCFGYIRVSTAKQGEGASLEAQKDAIMVFASQNGIQISKWFEELETASKSGRPVFGDMLKQLRRGKAKGVIMHRIDRSARNFSDWARLDEIARDGVKVYFAADSLDFDTRGGRLLADIQMALAADYSRNLSIEAKKGLYGRLKQGIYPFRAPIGYRDEGGGQLKSVDPVKAPLVKELFRLYLTGDYSITTLTEEMSSRGLTGYNGRTVVRRNTETILKTPFYCGQILVRGKLFKGKHETLISVAQFRRVQAMKSNRCGKKVTKHGLQYRGLVFCGYCKTLLTGERQRNHIYYRCHTAKCPERTIREDRLEHQVVKALGLVEIPSKDQTRIKEKLRTWIERNGQKDMERSIKLRVADVNAKQDRLTDLLVDGTIDEEAFKFRKDNLAFDMEQLRGELAAIEKNRLAFEDYEELVSIATSLKEAFRHADPAYRRQLLRNSFDQMLLHDGELRCSPARWLNGITKAAPEGLGEETVQTALQELGNRQMFGTKVAAPANSKAHHLHKHQ